MLPYLVAFGICTVICILGCASPKSKDAGFVVASVIVVLLLSLLAGLRSQTVGTDTQGYALPLYNLALGQIDFSAFYHQNWFRTWGWSSVDTIEIGYLILVWVSAKIGSFQFLLFMTSLLTVGPIYLALAMRRRELSLPLGFFVFMLLYFNVTLNAMRQWVAIAFMFLALIGVYDHRRPFRSQPVVIVLLVVSFIFHTSAILGLIPLLLMWFLKRGSVGLRLGLVVVLAAFILLGVNDFRTALIDRGFVRYANYFGDGNIQFSVPQLILRLPFLSVAFYLYTAGIVGKREAAFYLCMALIGLICGQFSTLTSQSGRIGQYFDIYLLPAVGILARPSAGPEKQRGGLLSRKITFSGLLSAFVVLYSIAYWYYSYLLMNSSETIPYLFFWS